MPNARLASRLLALLPVGLLAGVAALAIGCTKEPAQVQLADTSNDRVGELERRLREIENQNSELRQAGAAAGLSQGSLGTMVIELNGRIRKLEGELAAAKASGGVATAPATDASGGSATPSTPSTVAFAPDASGAYTPEQVTSFRRLAEEVERQKNLEQQAERVKRELARAKVTLTPEQEAAVVGLQATYQEKMREVFRGGGFGASDEDRDQTRAKLETLRAQFDTELRGIVPASDADKIAEAMRRGFPGLFPRRMDGRAGMRNDD
jgi:hypothetical protein